MSCQLNNTTLFEIKMKIFKIFKKKFMLKANYLDICLITLEQ